MLHVASYYPEHSTKSARLLLSLRTTPFVRFLSIVTLLCNKDHQTHKKALPQRYFTISVPAEFQYEQTAIGIFKQGYAPLTC